MNVKRGTEKNQQKNRQISAHEKVQAHLSECYRPALGIQLLTRQTTRPTFQAPPPKPRRPSDDKIKPADATERARLVKAFDSDGKCTRRKRRGQRERLVTVVVIERLLLLLLLPERMLADG